MNKKEEKTKLQELLLIPISDICFNDKDIEIFSGQVSIGNIPYYSNTNLIIYDTSDEALNWLKWDFVFNQDKKYISDLVSTMIKTEKFILTCATFRKLYVKDNKGNLLLYVSCSYTNGQWEIFKENNFTTAYSKLSRQTF